MNSKEASVRESQHQDGGKSKDLSFSRFKNRISMLFVGLHKAYTELVGRFIILVLYATMDTWVCFGVNSSVRIIWFGVRGVGGDRGTHREVVDVRLDLLTLVPMTLIPQNSVITDKQSHGKRAYRAAVARQGSLPRSSIRTWERSEVERKEGSWATGMEGWER
jgi:hypothetical protein